ncbi:MAG: TerB family tellurite resistance protein [Polyangiaceae bacterium]
MFGRWLSTERKTELTGADALEAAVRRELPSADRETIQVVSALTGLLGAVAYADRNFSQAEEERLLVELTRIQGMTAAGARAITTTLRQQVLAVSSVGIPHLCRTLRDLGDRELRLEVLEALVGLAAADGVIDQAEVNLVRQVTSSLGLSQDDYNESQARHRDKLASLR